MRPATTPDLMANKSETQTAKILLNLLLVSELMLLLNLLLVLISLLTLMFL